MIRHRSTFLLACVPNGTINRIFNYSQKVKIKIAIMSKIKFGDKPYNWKYYKKISSTHKKLYLLALVEFFTTLLLIEISIII